MTLLLSQIYIADDHEIVAKGISALVRKVLDTEAVHITKNGEELIRKVLSQKPSLVILDVEMPVKDGLETLKDLRGRGYTFPILMLSMVEEQAIIQSAMDLGANGYLHKDCSEEELKEALEATNRNEFYLSKEAKNAMIGVKSSNQSKNSPQTYNITKRELEVLELICEGLTSKEVGNKLFISARTVESHKENLMQKLDVNSSSKLVAKALKNRMV
jgi:DNA-binding NarL/FixJ family response regulator